MKPSYLNKRSECLLCILNLSQVDEGVRVNGEREEDGLSIEKTGPQRNKAEEEDSLQFFSSSYQHTDSDMTDSEVSVVQPTVHMLSSTRTAESPEKHRDTTEVSMCCYKQNKSRVYIQYTVEAE